MPPPHLGAGAPPGVSSRVPSPRCCSVSSDSSGDGPSCPYQGFTEDDYNSASDVRDRPRSVLASERGPVSGPISSSASAPAPASSACATSAPGKSQPRSRGVRPGTDRPCEHRKWRSSTRNGVKHRSKLRLCHCKLSSNFGFWSPRFKAFRVLKIGTLINRRF